MKTLQELAQDAIDAQNAVNIAGVAGLLQRTHSELRKRYGTSVADKHVIVRAIIDKLSDMTNEPRMFMNEWGHLGDIAEGKVPALEAMGEAVSE